MVKFHAVGVLLLFASAALADDAIQAPPGGITPGNLYSAGNSSGDQAEDSGIAASSISVGLTEKSPADYVLDATDRVVALMGPVTKDTGPITWTLACAENLHAGQIVQIIDPSTNLVPAGDVSPLNTLTIVPPQTGCTIANTLNGSATNTAQLNSPGARAVAISDGSSNWSVTVIQQPERTLDFVGNFGGVPATAIGASDCTVSEVSGVWQVNCPRTTLTQADKGDAFEAQGIGPNGSTYISKIVDLSISDPQHTFILDTTGDNVPQWSNGNLLVVDSLPVDPAHRGGGVGNEGYTFDSVQSLDGGTADAQLTGARPVLMTVVGVRVNTGGSGGINHIGTVLTLNPDPVLAGHVNALSGTQATFTGTISGGALTVVTVLTGALYRDLKYYTPGTDGWYRNIPIAGGNLTGATVDIQFGVVSEAISIVGNAYTVLPCTKETDEEPSSASMTTTSGHGEGLQVFCTGHQPLVSFGYDNEPNIEAVNKYETAQISAHAPVCVNFSGRFLSSPVDADDHITGGPCLTGDAQILSGIFIFPGKNGDIFPILNANANGSVGPVQAKVVLGSADQGVKAGTYIANLTFWGDWSSSVVQNAIKFYGFTQWATVENVSSWNVKGCLICVGSYADQDKGRLGLIAESTFINLRSEFTGDKTSATPAFGLDGIGNDGHDTNSANNDLILRYRTFDDNGLPLTIRPCVRSGVSNEAHQLTISELKIEESNMEQSLNATDAVQVGATGDECRDDHWTELQWNSGTGHWAYNDYSGDITSESGVRGIAFIAPSISNPSAGTAAFHFKGCISGDLESMRILGGAVTSTSGQNGLGLEFDVSADGNVVDLVKNSTTDYNLVYSGTFNNPPPVCGDATSVVSGALEYDPHDQATTAYIDDNSRVMTVLRRALGGGLTGCAGASGSLADTNSTQTLTNKTLTAPTLTSASLSSPSITAPTINMSNLLMSPTAPTILSGFGTSPSLSASNGSAAFQITIGSGGAATGSVSLPTAANGWACSAADVTTQSSTVFLTKQTGSTTNSATFKNYNSIGANVSWAAGDKLNIGCHAF